MISFLFFKLILFSIKTTWFQSSYLLKDMNSFINEENDNWNILKYKKQEDKRVQVDDSSASPSVCPEPSSKGSLSSSLI